MSDLAKNVLNVVKSKTGKKVTPQSINRLASRVTPSTLRSEKQLRALIMQVAKTVNVKVPEATVKELIRTIQQNSGSLNVLEQLMKSMMGK